MEEEDTKILIIPEGTSVIKKEEFANLKNLEEVIIPNSVIIIDDNAFTGCSSLRKIKLSNNLRIVGKNVFANCKNLEEIEIPESLTYIGYGMFAYCSRLKKIKFHDKISYFDNYAFYNCRQLKDFLFPNNITSIGVKSLCGCNKIKKLYIPKTLDSIDLGALSFMSSLEKITVADGNPTYMALDDVALINTNDGILLQYAINSKEESYTVGYYPILFGDVQSKSLIYNIGDYAFAGAKHLEEININSEIESIGSKTFLNCNKLDNLNIFFTSFGKVFLCNVYNSNFSKAHIPFKNIKIAEGVTTLTDNLSVLFRNAREVHLPNTLEHIGSNGFRQSHNLKKLEIPEAIRMIMPQAFYHDITLDFKSFGKVKAREFNMLETKTSDDAVKRFYDRDNVRIFSLTSGIYYVTIDDYDVIKVSKEEIAKLSSTSCLVENNPDTFFYYLNNLLAINTDYHKLITNVIKNKSLSLLFEKFISDIDYVREIAEKKNSRAIREIIDTKAITDETIFNGVLMKNAKKEDLVLILQNLNDSLLRFIKFNDCFNVEKKNDRMVTKLFDNTQKWVDYCNLLEKYKLRDRFLYNQKFFLNIDSEMEETLLKNYNSNIKRLIKESLVLEEDDSLDTNFKDLLKLAQVMGVFSGDARLSQRACNFITEKIFAEVRPNGLENEYRIVGNSLHKVFNELEFKKLNAEFILFFIENYQDLFSIEKDMPGFISRVCNSFSDISTCSMADTGSQRHLKVTLQKCKQYFLMSLYDLDEITDDDLPLAELLGKYYKLTNEMLAKAKSILAEASQAPRNIFTKVMYNENGKAVYNQNAKYDLKENVGIQPFTYEWLPKQDVTNLILGKHCACCAHIKGAGAGIMYASMVLDCCQNMVIRDMDGRIIAKATLWVNKDAGYAIFNTVEMNTFNTIGNVYLDDLYDAFMRGTQDFLKVYNENNPEKPIFDITIGKNRNAIKECLEVNEHSEISPYSPLDYSKYGYQLDGKECGKYSGDSIDEQILVLKRK